MSYITFRNESKINKNRLDYRYSSHFSSNSLMDRISIKLCQESILSKKEYCESVELVKIIQRHITLDDEVYIYDICGGHGFTGILLTSLCKNIIKTYIVDTKQSLAYEKLILCVSSIVENLNNKVEFISDDFNNIKYKENSVLIGVHACGIRTDQIINLAITNKLNAIVLPCCYKKNLLADNIKKYSDIYNLKDIVDFCRITKALENNFKVSVKIIPDKITPMNKVFIFKPDHSINN